MVALIASKTEDNINILMSEGREEEENGFPPNSFKRKQAGLMPIDTNDTCSSPYTTCSLNCECFSCSEHLFIHLTSLLLQSIAKPDSSGL